MVRTSNTPRDGAQSLRRALSVLRVVAAGREAGVPLADVVEAIGLTRPTAHRLISVLVDEGIIEKRWRSRRYAIGHQVSELAMARPSRSKLVVAAEPFMRDLSGQVGDTAFLTIRTGMDALCVARLIGGFPIQVLSIDVGARRPLGVSSAGVAILAALPLAEARQILQRNQARFASYKTNVTIAMQQIAAAKSIGYGVHHLGLVPGTKAVSATIRDIGGRPLAAVTIAAIRSRLGPRREPEVGEILQKTAGAIEAALRNNH